MNPFNHAIYNSIPFFDDSVTPALTVNDVTENSLYWPHVYRAVDWPEITTNKNYFILYSTDHDLDSSSTGGGIWWGEFDSFTETGITGFIEKGLIIEGYQAETPWLIRIPTSVSGLANDTIFLYYHTYQSPGYVIDQETQLITTTGGELHTATWTLRDKPLNPPLTGEDHLGYSRPFFRADNSLITHHLYDSNDFQGGKVSESIDGLSFSRIAQFDATENMPAGSYFNRIQIAPFNHNNTLYGFINMKGENAGIAIVKLDTTTYLPSEFVKSILYYDIRDLRVYIENGVANFFLKQGTSQDNGKPYFLWKYELSNILI